MSHDRIGPTAYYTAYVWHRLGLPHAEAFATPTGAVLYWGFFAAGEWATRLSQKVPSMRQYLEFRHRLIEAEVERWRPDRLIEIGAGLSRRGITWARDRSVQSWEVDLPAMVAAKRRMLREHGLEDPRLQVVEGDVLGPGFGEQLDSMIGDAARPVVVAEGLLSYFDLADRTTLFATVAAALRRARGGALLCDLHTLADQARVGSAAKVLKLAISAVTRRRRALDPYASREAIERALTDAGFDDVAHVDRQDHVRDVPQLRGVHSPALIYRGCVAASSVDGPAARD